MSPQQPQVNAQKSQAGNEPARRKDFAEDGKPCLIVDVSPEIVAVDEHGCGENRTGIGLRVYAVQGHGDLVAEFGLAR